MFTMHWMASIPRRGVDVSIRAYQRYLSPHKGFTCAHVVARGGQSCSAAVRDIVTANGVLRGTLPTLARFYACHQAAAMLQSGPVRVRGVCCCGGIPIPFRI
ncbi:MAG TPA: membrane protein insertion efficiency factor YidD [Arachnia sp.]|nr:membrane protein insertion efficiency factor YidD [Arachnia sp.]